MNQVVAFSGGKDSTAVALMLWEMGEDFSLLFTPTGNELPELVAHMAKVCALTGKELITPPNKPLSAWIEHFDALPNHRQRWCTRLIKIQPCIAYLKANPGTTLCVGLRADELERSGLYGEYGIYRYPLREAGYGLSDVVTKCRKYGLMPEFRTDCAVCPYQRLGEWFNLWRDFPAHWAEGEAWEAKTGRTFRSDGRDSWPAAMKDLRLRFETGEAPDRSLAMMKRDSQACRICAL